MTAEVKAPEQNGPKSEAKPRGGSGDTVYAIGLIGAWIYYIRRARTVREGLLGFLKGFGWPAILVIKLLKSLEQE